MFGSRPARGRVAFPEVGRWIKCSIGDHTFKCEVKGYENVEGWSCSAVGFFDETEQHVAVTYEDGDDDSFSSEDLAR